MRSSPMRNALGNSRRVRGGGMRARVSGRDVLPGGTIPRPRGARGGWNRRLSDPSGAITTG